MKQEKIQELIICSKQGDTKSFEMLVLMFQPLVFQLSFRLLCNDRDAEDVVQEVFVKAWLKLDKYNPKYRFSTWIYRITCNMCYDRLRSMKRYPEPYEISHSVAEYAVISSDNIETTVVNRELKELILYFTAELSPKQRIVFMLSDIEDMETKEIEKITGLSAGQIKSNLHLARKHIRNKITKITS
jgi:RNA polymerase sigma-70 factor (ECF subfamily)